MAASTSTARRIDSIKDEIDELKKKLTLLDGDKKAHYENTQFEMEKNRTQIQHLRRENKELRMKLARKMAADDDVVGSVFKENNMRPPPDLRGLPAHEAHSRFDQAVCELIKKRNALQYTARNKQRQLESLQKELAHMKSETEAIASTPAGESENAKKLRALENQLDRAIIQSNEANQIQKIYKGILEKMQLERLNYDNEISELKKSISSRKKNLLGLQSMNNDADTAREMTKAELQNQEVMVAESKKIREKTLDSYRKKAQEKKDLAEKVEKRVQLRRISIAQESAAQLSEGDDQSIQEQEEKITSYEEAFAKIKDATGVSDIQEVVDRFLNQQETRTHLNELKDEHTKQLARLKEEKDKLQAQFEEMKYSGEERMSSGQRLLEEVQSHLSEAKARCTDSDSKADRAGRLLGQVKAGITHLSEKLQHIKAPHTHVLKPHLEPGSEEGIIEMLGECEVKLVSLVEELGSRDLDTIQKEMEDEEFRQTVEGGSYTAGGTNVRIVLPKDNTGAQRGELYDESDDEDEGLMRETMKRETQLLVDSKTKKKPQDDEEEEDNKGKQKRR
ncbi:PREDICTED: coiled-coil domain-containing protein 151-like [Amphimedon queenslandica]|uniref:ODAD1 central coiled coil region domain-containing protein n=1 Tax=Amphimedon queenslandica TaxID=400682 RepID=A0A1X7URG5_AMPQE|nr:PREDICTED: coiled-coil domain-containing protein 151-like [Amphimedon queenslandica]|eukprot:XP_003387037.3 PREDICTED: coiled-coil domain-containing protein 151-like [Amphimedon queenslandica]